MVRVRVLTPMEYASNIMELIKCKQGTRMETRPIDKYAWQIVASVLWAEVVTNFHNKLKSTLVGYNSFGVSEEDPPL